MTPGTLLAAAAIAATVMSAPASPNGISDNPDGISGAPDSTSGKDYRVFFGATAGYGRLLGSGEYGKRLVRSHDATTYALSGGRQALPSSADPYEQAYGCPQLEGGLLLCDYTRIRLNRDNAAPYNSGMGYEIAGFAAFRREVLRSRRFGAGYVLENGIGLSTRPYSRTTNADNEFTGSRMAVYIGLGLFATWHIDHRTEASLGVDFKHFSNGALDRPNKGANTVGLSARIACATGRKGTDKSDEGLPSPTPATTGSRFSGKHLYADIAAGWSGHTALDEWLYNYTDRQPDDPHYRSSSLRIYSSPVASTALMWRYSLKYASGIGLDYTYATYTRRTAEMEQLRGTGRYRHSRHVLGVSLRHEAFYRRLSLQMGLGAYLFRRMGYMARFDEKPYFETVGVKFTPPICRNSLYIGYQVKAHLLKADCMQVLLGLRLGRAQRKAGQP